MKKFYCDRCNVEISSLDTPNKIKVTEYSNCNIKLEEHKYLFCNGCLNRFYKLLNERELIKE